MTGKTVSHYEIREKLGAGGMGVVYRARDTRLERDVALKFLPPHLAENDESRNRFVQEARAASALDHPNICTIHDIDATEDGRTFIAMGFYSGKTLDELTSPGVMTIEQSCSIVRQIAAGLARAHDRKIVHRDIKPSNILITDDGVAKILDFGLAKLSGTADITKDGSTVGTAAYMSPEQTRGENVDGRTDIWSLAVVLFELLTGRRPFEGDYEHAITYSILNEEAPSVKSLRPDVDEGLSDIVAKCLTKNARDRWSSMRDLHAALGQYAAEDPSVVGVGSSGSDANPLRTTILFSVVAAITLAAVYALMLGIGLPDWVFPAAVILILAGFPVMFLASKAERRRSKGKTGFAASKALDKLLTVRKASLGGLGVFGGLALVVAAYMFMRSSGIGPFATLVSKGAFDANPTILVAEFDSPTEDEAVAQTVSEALRIDLGQSNIVRSFERREIVDGLRRMNLAASTELDPETAAELAAREGIDAVVVGEVSQIGTGYVLSLRLLETSDGSTLLSLRETASDDADLIPSVDRLSQKLRERIGESIKDVRDTPALGKVTTSSLAALQYYTAAEKLAMAGREAEAFELLQSAVREDSTFAMAHRKLAAVLRNMGHFEEAQRASLASYRYRTRLPDYEKALTEATYHLQVDYEPGLVESAYRSILSNRPDDYIALNNLGLTFLYIGRAEALELFERLIQVEPGPLSVSNYVNALVSSGNIEGTSQLLDSLRVSPAQQLYRYNAGQVAYLKGELAVADSLYDRMTREDTASRLDRSDGYKRRSMLAYLQGNMSDGLQHISHYEQEVLTASPPEYLDLRASVSLMYSLTLADESTAVSVIDDALIDVPMESIEPARRPYRKLAVALAAAGDVSRARSMIDKYYREVPLDRRWDSEPQYERSVVLLFEGNPEASLAEFERATTLGFLSHHYFHAIALDRLGRPEDAVDVLESYRDMPHYDKILHDGLYRIPTLLYLSELHVRLGNIDDAIDALAEFVALWENAELELQPLVQEARGQIDRLVASQVREPS